MNEVRRRGSIWLGIVVVVVFFACVTFAVASLGGGPGIPHRVGGEVAACTTCHPVDRLPRDHQDRTGDGCRSCHSPAPAE